MAWRRVPREKKQELEALLDEIEGEFDEMKWTKTFHRKNVSDGGCYSSVLGRVFVPYHGVQDSRFNKLHPRLFELLQQLAALLDFECTSFTINKNVQCKPHLDKNNYGDSLILALGDFSGGLLRVENQDFDIFRRVLCFNGATSLHETMPFSGTRYSIVMYSIKTAKITKK
jgi:hypothetical protein